VLTFAEEARHQQNAITHAGERIVELEAEEAGLLVKLGEEGQAISRRRRAAAEEMAKAVESELTDLHMLGSRFRLISNNGPIQKAFPWRMANVSPLMLLDWARRIPGCPQLG
jgi:DNA repair protein RecN (Recombination protein N)